jgi:hypothetical protein
MKKLILLLALTTLIISCNTTEPPNGEKPTLTLKLEDASCTEAWIELTTANLQLPTNITLKQDGETRETINIITTDTLLCIDSLLPNTNYRYQASSIQNPATSNELSVTTLDTTSHNFTFETFTFGGTAGSSILYDVAIVGEEIWAVGEIYVADTSINGYTMYNAVYWDGSEWELKRITVNFRGNLITPPLYGIYAFSTTDIWFSSGVPIHGDGSNWIQYHLFDMGILNQNDGYLTKVWGTSSSDLYFVGTLGTIAHYNGQSWMGIESGTDLHLYDIYGDYSGIDNDYEILVAAANRSISPEKQILKISNTNTVTPLVTEGIPHSIVGIWFKADKKYYVCGSGLFKKNDIQTSEAWEGLTVSNVYLESINGDELNDIMICGSFGELQHYNGISWRAYEDMPVGSVLLSVKIMNNIAVTVGINNPRAFISFGRR